MKTAPYEKSLARVRQAIDVPWMDSLARKACYLLGQDWNGYKESSDLGSSYWPYYPHQEVKRLKVGMGRDILNTAYLSLSRMMSSDPAPVYSGVDDVTAEARAAFWLKRYKEGGPTGNGFSMDVASAYLEFDNFGLGGLFVGVEDSKTADGMAVQRASAKHVSCLDLVYDPCCLDPNDSPYGAHREFVPLDFAIDRYGSDVKKHSKRFKVEDFRRKRQQWNTDQPHDVVEVVHYWDKGIGRYAPTKRCFVGGIAGSAVSWAEEHDLPFLPYVWFVNFLPPNCLRPMGRIDLMTATQEQKNQLIKYLRNVLAKPPVDIIDPESMDMADVRQWGQGEPIAIKTTRPMENTRPVWDRKPGQEAPTTLFNFLQEVDRQLNEDGQSTEIERGNALPGDNTKFEVAQVQAAAQMNRAWPVKQTALGFRRLIRVFEEVASRWDTEPVIIDVNGSRVPVNDPGVRESWADQLYLEPAEVLVDTQSLTPQDDKMKGQQKRAELGQLMPFVGKGVNSQWFVKEILKTMGVRDVEDAMAPEAPPLGTDPLAALMQGMGTGQDAAVGAGASQGQ